MCVNEHQAQAYQHEENSWEYLHPATKRHRPTTSEVSEIIARDAGFKPGWPAKLSWSRRYSSFLPDRDSKICALSSGKDVEPSTHPSGLHQRHDVRLSRLVPEMA